MEKTALAFLITLAASFVCDAHKILVVSPYPGRSHNILGHGVVRNLLMGGHEVTYITTAPELKHENLTSVDISSHWNLVDENIFSIDSFIKKGGMDIGDPWFLYSFLQTLAVETFTHPNVQTLLADHSLKFDLVVLEWLFNELYCGFSAIYDVPFVWLSTFEPSGMMLSIVDEYLNPAYNDYFVDSDPPFGFKDRITELFLTMKSEIYRFTVNFPAQAASYNEVIVPHIKARGRIPPSFEELKYNASLVLGNSHVSLGQATRLPQIYKPIGGYHIPQEVQPLPDDLKKIMDSSKDGVIYFSLGSNIKSKFLPKEIKADILNVFKTLKQTVLWKFEEEFSDVPKNVHILKWAPQQSILAHPNCILFITHSGMLSTTETIHFGVPIIGIPFFVDQFMNINRSVKKGYAKRVQMSYEVGKHLKEAIEDVLTDRKYTERARELSFIYHDRPMKPGAELVHWVEHVINTGGAPHLRSPALHVPWYQKAYLDLALLLAALIYLSRTAIKLLLNVLPKKRSEKKKKH